MRSSNQTPKGFESLSKGMMNNNAQMRTPLNDNSNYQSKRVEVNNRGKTAPSSSHNSKERVEFPEKSKKQMFSKPHQMSSEALQSSIEDDQPKSGLIGHNPAQPKRSESQKIRGNSQHHFMKRKDGVSAVESQHQDITKALREKLQQEDCEEVTKIEERKQNPAVPAKQPQPEILEETN